MPKPGQATQLLRVRPSLGGSDGKSGAGGGAGILRKRAASGRGRGPATSGCRACPSAAPGRAAPPCFPGAWVAGLCHLRGPSGCTRGRGAGWPLLRWPQAVCWACWLGPPSGPCAPPARAHPLSDTSKPYTEAREARGWEPTHPLHHRGPPAAHQEHRARVGFAMPGWDLPGGTRGSCPGLRLTQRPPRSVAPCPVEETSALCQLPGGTQGPQW